MSSKSTLASYVQCQRQQANHRPSGQCRQLTEARLRQSNIKQPRFGRHACSASSKGYPHTSRNIHAFTYTTYTTLHKTPSSAGMRVRACENRVEGKEERARAGPILLGASNTNERDPCIKCQHSSDSAQNSAAKSTRNALTSLGCFCSPARSE